MMISLAGSPSGLVIGWPHIRRWLKRVGSHSYALGMTAFRLVGQGGPVSARTCRSQLGPLRGGRQSCSRHAGCRLADTWLTGGDPAQGEGWSDHLRSLCGGTLRRVPSEGAPPAGELAAPAAGHEEQNIDGSHI